MGGHILYVKVLIMTNLLFTLYWTITLAPVGLQAGASS